jgi:RNA polymerase sigma-70 factor, ECF subfamily
MMDGMLRTRDDLSDAALVALIRQGERRAFAAIMRRNNRRLFRLVRAILGDDAAAEEAVQETYVRAFAALDGWRGEGSLATWLSRIALNEAFAALRGRRVTVPIDEMPESAGGLQMWLTPEALAARGEIRRLLERAIDELPADFRAAFVLRAVERLSVEEAAAALSVPANTLRTRFFRAKKLLRQALGRKIAVALEDAFPFAGARCDRLVETVMQRLEKSP